MKTSPTDFELALCSAHAYYATPETEKGSIAQFPEGSLEKLNPHLTKWKVEHVHYAPEANSYLGILYINSDTKQLILAHRGTSFSLPDFIGNSLANLKGVVFGEEIPMQDAAFEITQIAFRISKELDHGLHFTGHSLGGWLAIQSMVHPEADSMVVTFDAPGAKQVLSRLGIKETPDKVKQYLTHPNMVNACGEHVGEMWQINTERDMRTEWIKNLAPTKISPFTTSGHCMESILKEFDEHTGKPSACEKITSWPKYQFPKNTPMGDIMKSGIEWFCGDGLLAHTTKVCVSTMCGEVDATGYYNAFVQPKDGDEPASQATGFVGEVSFIDLFVL